MRKTELVQLLLARAQWAQIHRRHDIKVGGLIERLTPETRAEVQALTADDFNHRVTEDDLIGHALNEPLPSIEEYLRSLK